MSLDTYIKSDFGIGIAILLMLMGGFMLMRGNARVNLPFLRAVSALLLIGLGGYVLAYNYGLL